MKSNAGGVIDVLECFRPHQQQPVRQGHGSAEGLSEPAEHKRITLVMGNQASSPSRVTGRRTPVGGSGGGGLVVGRAIASPAGGPRLPIPEDKELDVRLKEVIRSMNLQPEHVTAILNFSPEKKWDIVCDQERVQAKDPPSTYLTKLRSFLDPSAKPKTKAGFIFQQNAQLYAGFQSNSDH